MHIYYLYLYLYLYTFGALAGRRRISEAAPRAPAAASAAPEKPGADPYRTASYLIANEFHHRPFRGYHILLYTYIHTLNRKYINIYTYIYAPERAHYRIASYLSANAFHHRLSSGLHIPSCIHIYICTHTCNYVNMCTYIHIRAGTRGVGFKRVVYCPIILQ